MQKFNDKRKGAHANILVVVSVDKFNDLFPIIVFQAGDESFLWNQSIWASFVSVGVSLKVWLIDFS